MGSTFILNIKLLKRKERMCLFRRSQGGNRGGCIRARSTPYRHDCVSLVNQAQYHLYLTCIKHVSVSGPAYSFNPYLARIEQISYTYCSRISCKNCAWMVCIMYHYVSRMYQAFSKSLFTCIIAYHTCIYSASLGNQCIVQLLE